MKRYTIAANTDGTVSISDWVSIYAGMRDEDKSMRHEHITIEEAQKIIGSNHVSVLNYSPKIEEFLKNRGEKI